MIRDRSRYASNFSPRTICGMVSRTPFHLFPSHRYSRLLLHSSIMKPPPSPLETIFYYIASPNNEWGLYYGGIYILLSCFLNCPAIRKPIMPLNVFPITSSVWASPKPVANWAVSINSVRAKGSQRTFLFGQKL